MYEKLEECPVCGSGNFVNHKVVTDHSVSKESFVICKCNGCSFQFTNPRPDQKNIAAYYQSDDYISHTNQANNPINWLYKIARNLAVRKKINLITKVNGNKTGRLLDYGCGTGFFLSNLIESGWEGYGVEPNQDARTIANQSCDKKVVQKLDELDLRNKKFHVITLWHVLEHIHDLNTVIKRLKSLLKEKGKMVIAVPNIDSADNEEFQEYWAAYDVPRHLYHFNPESMKTLVLKHGMKIKEIYPMKLDSYYIALLSNKYKTGNNRYLKSFLSGYKSNKKAKSNKTQYSSLIYEIKK